MRKTTLFGILAIGILVMMIPVNTEEISIAVSCNLRPKVRLNETAVIYIEGLNSGSVTVNVTISVLENDSLIINVQPSHFDEIDPGEQFITKVEITGCNVGIFTPEIEVLATSYETAEGTGAVLSTSIILKLVVTVSEYVNTTIESPPPGFYIPPEQPPEKERVWFDILAIVLSILIIAVLAYFLIIKRYLTR